MQPPYVFDSSSIRVLRNYYPDRFPSFWKLFDEAAAIGLVVSVREVYNELQFQLSGTWLWDWVQRHKSLFPQPTADETAFVGEIFKPPQFRALVGERHRLQGVPSPTPSSLQVRKWPMAA